MSDAQTLDELLRRRAAATPDKPCIETHDAKSTLSYAELDRRASRFAAILRGRHHRPGDRILLSFCNTPDFFVALFGCLRGGFVAVPIDPHLKAEERRVLLEEVRPAALLADAELAGAEAGKDAPISSATTALLLHSSGTTGLPKSVAYSHGVLLRKIGAIRRWFSLGDDIRALCLLPTHFSHGLICNCLPVFAYGGTLVLAPPFDLDLLGDMSSILTRQRIQTFSTVPTVVRLLARDWRRSHRERPASLRFVTCASAPLYPEEVEAFEAQFRAPLLNCYGLTETAGWSTCSPLGMPRNIASVGKPLDCQVRIVGPDGEPLAPGRIGEIQINGPNVIGDGWFATGDIGELDDTGELFLHSRIKELIIRAGKNVFPAEVDRVLLSHPDVIEACAVGLEDPLLGERVAACVVRRNGSLTEAALMAHVRERLSSYKCPQRIAFVERIPRNSRGKVNRSQLCTLFRE